MKKLAIVLTVILALLLIAAVLLTVHKQDILDRLNHNFPDEPVQTAPPTDASTEPPTEQPTDAPATVPTEPPTEPPTEAPTEAPTEPPFTAKSMADSDPASWNVEWDVIVDGEITESYTREDQIFFEDTQYLAFPGVASFRGSNYRQDASYGTAEISSESLDLIWSKSVGYVEKPEWGGCCWTGQPLVVQWDAETKAIMNMYEDKKAKEDLVEVIYAKADGYVHFFDIDDGSATRDPLYIGMAFKGSGAIDPRGYPILYVGAGLNRGSAVQRIYIISLIDGSTLYSRSGYEPLAKRSWCAFDGAPLVDAETDTLIWGGENGILYTFKLNTQYDKAAGTLTMEPDEPVMTRYSDSYKEKGRDSGYESSVTCVENYLYVGDNSGMLQCVDMNTMDIVWVQDMVDDINATPLFDWGEDGNGYIYSGPSMDFSGYSTDIPLSKIDARTGEVIWSHTMTAINGGDVPGGVLASPILGRAGTNMEDLVIFAVGKSPNAWKGQVVAFNKNTGEVVWQFETNSYMWSSPVGIYTEDGKGYIFQADASGRCYLLNGATGEKEDVINLERTVEASPVVFGDKIVLGSRSSMYIFDVD